MTRPPMRAPDPQLPSPSALSIGGDIWYNVLFETYSLAQGTCTPQVHAHAGRTKKVEPPCWSPDCSTVKEDRNVSGGSSRHGEARTRLNAALAASIGHPRNLDGYTEIRT